MPEFPILFSAVLFGCVACYVALMIAYGRGVRRVVNGAFKAERAHPPISVIVAARNEERDLPRCIESIARSTYPPDRFELIVVDDFSEDDTATCVLESARRHPDHTIRLLRMEETGAAPTGFKHDAIAAGIEAAEYDILLTTDADCTVEPGWIEAMAASFAGEVDFVAGPVRFAASSFFGRLQALDFAGLIALGAGAIGFGRPNTCNSANAAYRRSAYERFTPPAERIVAGQDELLLHAVAADDPGRVRFCADPAALVTTHPESTLAGFIRQRRRWAATGASYPGWWQTFSIGLLFLTFCLLAVALVLALTGVLPFELAGAALAAKLSADAYVIAPALRQFGQERLWRIFVPAQLFQLAYIPLVGLSSAGGSVEWKGRRLP